MRRLDEKRMPRVVVIDDQFGRCSLGGKFRESVEPDVYAGYEADRQNLCVNYGLLDVTGDARRDRPLVLVVDDEAPARELLASWLEPEGYQLITAGSSAEALAKAAEHVPDAITLNMLMPGKGGWDTLYELKKTPVTAGIPVIVVTVVDEPKIGLALGAAEYLVKPVDKEVLLETIRRHIGPGSDGPAKVLVVDDEAGTRELLKEMLESDGYIPVLASSGKEALEALARISVSAILLDLIMPEMDGFEMRPPPLN